MNKFFGVDFLKACKERSLQVVVVVDYFNKKISSFAIKDLDTPHFYSDENTECVYHTICKKILSEILNTHFGNINERQISRYLSSKDWLKGMKIIYDKIGTLKKTAFKEWHKKQTADLEKIKEQYYQYKEK